ncbi:hypothetical protein SAMN06265347_103118 [Halobellus salinus]|nr:hypothetical protein SAMN06265347_103118 [Halobellus salinus]
MFTLASEASLPIAETGAVVLALCLAMTVAWIYLLIR